MRYHMRGEAIADLFGYIGVFYSRSCRHSCRSPVQFLQDWITNQREQKIAG